MKQHWDQVYRDKPADAVSWYRARLDASLALLERHGLSPASRVLDVGGGASTLVDDLVARGVGVTVLDLSSRALEVARARLGAAPVRWIVGDVETCALDEGAFTHWHDRAALHFLPDPTAYARQAARAVAVGGIAVIAGFAPDGPERCSGLPVTRRGPDDVAQAMGPDFELIDSLREVHRTPWGSEQAFAYAVLRRLPAADAALR